MGTTRGRSQQPSDLRACFERAWLPTWGEEPSLSIAFMDFYGVPGGDPLQPRSLDAAASARTLPLGKGTVTGWEYIPRFMRGREDDRLYVHCSTPEG